jgi:hypothetical protein
MSDRDDAARVQACGGDVDSKLADGDVRQQTVEQHLVAVAHVGQKYVLGQIVGLAAVLGVHPPQLPHQRGYPR